MRIITVFLLIVALTSVITLWFLRDSSFFDLANSQVARFADVLAQAFLSSALLGLLFELAVWNFGDNQIRKEVNTARSEVLNFLDEQFKAILDKIPTLTAGSLENLQSLNAAESSRLIERVLVQHSTSQNIAKAVARMAEGVMGGAALQSVVDLRHDIKIFEKDDVYRFRDDISYSVKRLGESFIFGFFKDMQSFMEYTESIGPVDGYWIVRSAFLDDGSFNGEMAYVSNLILAFADGRKETLDLKATRHAGAYIFRASTSAGIQEATVFYRIDSFLSAENPLVLIATPFVSEEMSVRFEWQVPGPRRILYRVSAPTASNVVTDEDSDGVVSVRIRDVVFPGHGVLFSIRHPDLTIP